MMMTTIGGGGGVAAAMAPRLTPTLPSEKCKCPLL